MTAYDLRISGHCPPAEARVARALRFDGVYDRELLEHASRWGADADRAWSENDRLELVLPLAILRGVPLERVCIVGREWVHAARDALGEIEWPRVDRSLAANCLAEACAPDVDAALLDELRTKATERAGAKDAGRHRYELLTACSCVAALGRRRLGYAVGASFDAYMLAAVLRAAVDDQPATLSLFEPRVDARGFFDTCFAVASRELGAQEAAE